MIADSLIKAGLPGIEGVWSHEAGGGRLFITVAINQRYCGHSRQVGYVAAQCQAAAYMNRFVVVVDDDIDPTRLDDVVWAMSTRCDPDEDIETMRKTWGSKADPLLVDHSVPYNSRAIIDACIPYERRNDFATVAETTPELLEKTARNWGHLFPDVSAPGGRPATSSRAHEGSTPMSDL
jgi:3-polyprenyl-4-hydroxybenzoate decarboxylase